MRQASRIPRFFEPILWSHNIRALDAERDKKTIVAQAINYGTLEHWRWLAARYGKDGVRRAIASFPKSALRPGALRLAALVFGHVTSRHASRRAH
ncbi:MAG: hypothetical protein HYY10_02795 [Candidatus Liptonbacteria bacterium]|nr:hypothetical protein [Candidatus Liptonbacteria bacterium]